MNDIYKSITTYLCNKAMFYENKYNFLLNYFIC